MKLTNQLVIGLLRSPFHRLLSGSVDAIRYTGRRSGRIVTTPTQYAWAGADVVILVGNPESKTWWRNFRTEAPLEILIGGSWHEMLGLAIIGADDPDGIGRALGAYLRRFPKAVGKLARPEDAVVVRCHPALDRR